MANSNQPSEQNGGKKDYQAELDQIKTLHRLMREENQDLRAGQTVKNERVSNMIGLLAFIAVLFLGNSALNGFLAYSIAQSQKDEFQRLTAAQRDNFSELINSRIHAMEQSVEGARSIIPALTDITTGIIGSVESRISASQLPFQDKLVRQVNDLEKRLLDKDEVLRRSIENLALEIKSSQKLPNLEVKKVDASFRLANHGTTDGGDRFCNGRLVVDLQNLSDFSVIIDRYKVYSAALFHWKPSNLRNFYGDLAKFEAVESRSDESRILPRESTSITLYKGIGIEAAAILRSMEEPIGTTDLHFRLVLESKSGGEAVLDIPASVTPTTKLLECIKELK